MKKLTYLIAVFLMAAVSHAQITLPGTWAGFTASAGGAVTFTSTVTDLDFGDGIGDGAILSSCSQAGVGQGVHYTFGGTMVDGATYEVVSNIGNNSGNQVSVKVSLFDLTTATELAFVAPFTIALNGVTGTNVTVSYTATALTAGHQLQLKYIRTDTGATNRKFYLDNVKLNGAIINPAVSTTTWNGTAWSNGAPTASSTSGAVAVVYTGNATNNNNFFASSITVTNGAVVTMSGSTTNGCVTLFGGPLVVDSGSSITFNSGVNGTSSGGTLVQTYNGLNSGNIIFKRNSNSLLRLDYTAWSSPVASQNLLDFSPATLPTRFYTYNTTTDLYNAVPSPSGTSFAAGAGYLIRMPDNADAVTPTAFSGVFTGVPNNGDIPVTLSTAGGGYNLVGNPYPSNLSTTLLVSGNSANIETTVYFWRKTNGAGGSAYATFNTTGSVGTAANSGPTPNAIIAPGQGFFVKALNAVTIPAFFKNSMRAINTTPAPQFLKTSQSKATDSHLWLNLTNAAGAFSQIAVGYAAGATLGVDNYDSEYINDQPLALTSNIDGKEYTIQGRPAFDASDVVNLNFKTDVAGEYTIAIDHSDGLFANGQDVYLVDSSTGAETNLKTDPYTFTATTGVANSRFSLKYQKTLKVDAPAFNENSVRVYKNNGTLYVNSGNVAISNIKVFDIQGRLITEQKNVKTTTATISNLKAIHQVLIVKIAGQDNNVVTKKVMN